MIIKVYKPDYTPPQKSVHLIMEDHVYGGVVIRAVMENGADIPSARLLTIEANGTLYLHWYVNPELGFQRDAQGRIKLAA